ncbi:MAG: HAMP domain-containing histidine kinase [Micrococcales bacterium]|nr:HAMP domain-containing histidine kinase [Micrococcales bacterium]
MGEQPAPRRPGPSVRLRLALSYAGFLVVAGVLIVAVVWVFLLRYVPDRATTISLDPAPGSGGRAPQLFVPGRYDLWRAFAPRVAQALLVLLVLGLAGGWLLAGRMVAPLTRMREVSRRVAAGSLHERVALPGRGDELTDLADAFDAMLTRLEDLLDEQRRFAANASHELRTPLATTRALLEVAAADPDRDTDRLLERLREVNDRAVDLTEALLLLARADQRAVAPEPVDLSLAAEQAAEVLLPLAERRGVAVEVAGEPVHALGSPVLLLQLVTNLVHNAVVHNLPAGGTATVTTRADGARAVVTVENTGEVLGADRVATLVEPFQRGQGRHFSDHGGSGLGLAIVRSIVRTHDGTLRLDALPGGGLRVVVELPGVPGLRDGD